MFAFFFFTVFLSLILLLDKVQKKSMGILHGETTHLCNVPFNHNSLIPNLPSSSLLPLTIHNHKERETV